MRVDNDNYNDKNISASKRPRFTIKIVFDAAGGQDFYLTSHADGVFASGGNGLKNCIPRGGISGQTQAINPDIATSTIGSITIKAQNINNALRDEINTQRNAARGLRWKTAVVYAGFEGMDWVDYEERHTMIIDDALYENGIYTFKLIDIQRQQRQNIFAPKQLYLRANVTEDALLIPVSGNALDVFETIEHDANYSVNPSITVGYVEIDGEVIAHSGMVNDAGLGISVQVISGGRGVFNTKAVAHDIDAGRDIESQPIVNEFIVLAGTVPKIAYAVLTGELYGQAGKVIPEHWHLGIDTSFVRISDFTGIGDDIWNASANTGKLMRFWGQQEVDGKRFIETDLFRWINCFSPIYANGQIGLRRLQPVLSDSATVAVLDETNVVKYGSLRHAFKKILNVISIDWNWDWRKEKFQKTTSLIDTDSIIIYGRSDAKTYEFKGLQTSVATDDLIRQMFDGLRDRYSGEPLLIPVSVLPSMNRLEVGDVVLLKLDVVEDFNTGTSLNRAFEVQQSSTDWTNGNINLSLFGSSLVAGALAPLSAAYSLTTTFYTSTGTDLNTLPEVTGGAVISNLTLNGGVSSMQTFYHDGNLTINAGITLTINNNVELRIKGVLTLNGTINGVGNGGIGGAGQTTLAGVPAAGDKAFGNTRAGGLLIHDIGVFSTGFGYSQVFDSVRSMINANSVYNATLNILATYSIRVTDNGDTLIGLPQNIKGSGGGGGGAVINRHAWGSGAITANPPYELKAAGGAGGNGGAGLSIIARGYAFGGSAAIDTSGADGFAGAAAATAIPTHASGGAGGAAGGVAMFVDGNASAPALQAIHIANYGRCLATGTKLNSAVAVGYDLTGGTKRCYNEGAFITGSTDYSANASHVQYLPRVENLEETTPPDITLPTPDTFTLISDSTTVERLGDGTVQPRMKATYTLTAASNKYIGSAEVQTKRSAEAASEWKTVSVIPNVDNSGDGVIYISGEAGVNYDARVRYITTGSLVSSLYEINGGQVLASAFKSNTGHTVTGDTSVPANVTGFTAAGSETGTSLLWNDLGNTIQHYEIREGGTSWATATFLTKAKSNSYTSNDIAQGTNTFWIKAVTHSNVESAAATSLIASIRAVNTYYHQAQKEYPPVSGVQEAATTLAFAYASQELVMFSSAPRKTVSSQAQAGAIYKYKYENGKFVYDSEITRGTANENFGGANKQGISVSGDATVIAAYFYHIGDALPKVRIYTLDIATGDYSPIQTLSPTGNTLTSSFGSGMKLNKDGTKLIITAAGFVNGTDKGSFFYYEWSGSVFTQTQKVNKTGSQTWAQLPAIDEDLSTICLSGRVDTDIYLTIAHYKRTGSVFSFVEKLSEASDNLLGCSLSGVGGVLVAGRNFTVNVYEKDAAGNFALKMDGISSPETGTDFGSTLAVSYTGDIFAAGGLGYPSSIDPTVTNVGRLFLYQRDADDAENWTYLDNITIQPLVAAANEYFGLSNASTVFLKGLQSLVVGAGRAQNGSGVNEGNFYLYNGGLNTVD